MFLVKKTAKKSKKKHGKSDRTPVRTRTNITEQIYVWHRGSIYSEYKIAPTSRSTTYI